MPWKGWYSDTPWPKVTPPDVVLTNVRDDRWTDYQRLYSNWALTEVESRELWDIDLKRKLASDDIRGLGHAFRMQYKVDVSELKPLWTKWTDGPQDVPMQALLSEAQVLSGITSAQQLGFQMRREPGSYGQWKQVERGWNEVVEISQVRKLRPIDWLRINWPGCYNDVRRLERCGLHRGAALDMVFGKVAGLFVGNLNPIVSAAVERSVAAVVGSVIAQGLHWNRFTWSWLVTFGSEFLSAALRRSGVYKMVLEY